MLSVDLTIGDFDGQAVVALRGESKRPACRAARYSLIRPLPGHGGRSAGAAGT